MSGEGLYFRYFNVDAEGTLQETKRTRLFKKLEELILQRIQAVLRGRPDLLKKLAHLPHGIEIHLYRANEMLDRGEGGEFVGRVTQDGEHITMEFAMGETLYGLENPHDGFEVITHELAHILDFMTDTPGQFPGWTAEQHMLFEAERAKEQKRIRQGTSPMAPYALVNDEEFLAVLAETFFEKPLALKASSPVLFKMMREFFNINPLKNPLPLPVIEVSRAEVLRPKKSPKPEAPN
jgi:hypothetical protein